MRKLNYVSILLAVITVLGLTSCEENYCCPMKLFKLK